MKGSNTKAMSATLEWITYPEVPALCDHPYTWIPADLPQKSIEKKRVNSSCSYENINDSRNVIYVTSSFVKYGAYMDIVTSRLIRQEWQRIYTSHD